MLTPADFRNRWDEDDEPLIPFSEESTAGLSIPADAITFLNEAGLPESAAPFLEFQVPESGRLETVAAAWQLSSEFESYRVIGFDGAGNPLCLDEQQRGAVVYLDHEHGFQRVFMNSSIQQLAESLLAFATMIQRAQEQNGEDAYLDGNIPEDVRAWVNAELIRIDEPAVAEGCFWTYQLAFLDPQT